MECFDVCLTMPISKIASVLNAEVFLFITLVASHMFLLSYLVLIDLRENSYVSWRVH